MGEQVRFMSLTSQLDILYWNLLQQRGHLMTRPGLSQSKGLATSVKRWLPAIRVDGEMNSVHRCLWSSSNKCLLRGMRNSQGMGCALRPHPVRGYLPERRKGGR